MCSIEETSDVGIIVQADLRVLGCMYGHAAIHPCSHTVAHYCQPEEVPFFGLVIEYLCIPSYTYPSLPPNNLF